MRGEALGDGLIVLLDERSIMGSEYQTKFKENFLKCFGAEPGHYRGAHSLRVFRGATCACGLRERNRALKSLWWQGCQLLTADRLTDITVGACAGIYPSGPAIGWKYL